MKTTISNSRKVVRIRLDDTTDWGAIDASDADREAYEQAVADAVLESYPGAEVDVQRCSRSSPRVVVTTRDSQGVILLDAETARDEEAIEAAVLEIAREAFVRSKLGGAS